MPDKPRDFRPPEPPVVGGEINLELDENLEFQWAMVREWWKHHKDHNPSMLLVDDIAVSRDLQKEEGGKAWKAWDEEGMAEAFGDCKVGANTVLARFIEAIKGGPTLPELLKEVERVRDEKRKSMKT